MGRGKTQKPHETQEQRMSERDQIVAWLRKEAGYSQAVADDESDFLETRARASQTAFVKRQMADCIEAGAHQAGEGT